MKNKFTKSILSWVLVFSMILPLMSSVIYTQAADGDIKNYDSMTMEEILASDESLTWVITGDSITHNGGWTAGLNSYGEWMEQYLYDSGRGDDSVVLTGWGGAATDDFQTAENTVGNNGPTQDKGMGIENFITKYNPDVVTIKLGMNDRYITKAKFKENYTQMLNSLYEICETEHKKIPKVVILTPTPIASENFIDDSVHGEVADGIYESTTRQRNALEDIANTYTYNGEDRDILFCDLRTAFLTEAQAMGEDYVNTFFQDPSDGAIHPNGAGQYCIFKNLAKTLGIYDETMPIFQIEYDDLVSHALYVDSTDGLDYSGDYDNADAAADAAEMSKTMPTILGVDAISSVEFTSDNGVLDMGEREGFSISSASEGVNTLTQAEAVALEDSFSVVFRAKLGSAYNTNQPVLFISASGTANWDNALVLGIPGSKNQLYFNAQEGNIVNKLGQINLSGTTVAGDGTWHTIATVYDAGTISYYVDGTLIDSASGYGLKDGVTSLGSLFANSTDFQAQIGRFGLTADGTSYKLNGNFDYWQLYSEALTAEQVLTLAGDDADNDASSEETASWTDTVVENYTWAIAGGAQMSGYDGVAVNRSLMRYIENAVRGGSWTYRDIHVFNLASADYDVATLVNKFDTLAEERAYDVFMLLPETPEVYESGYVHSASAVATYKENIKTLISKNSGKVIVLWSPYASNDTTINGYIDDYAEAVREIAASDKTILFFDANQFMNDSMSANASLLNNWFEDGQYVSPLCNVDVARAFFAVMSLSGAGESELIDHNLRYTSDKKVYKGNYVKDNIAASAAVSGTSVSVDMSAIVAAYPNAELSIAVLPYKTVENYNEDTVLLKDVAAVTVSGNVYTFEAPCADLNLAIYGEQDGLIYRFKDISLDVETTATIPEKKADGVYLDSLEVMSAPAIRFDKDTTSYNVDLYQYQTYASVRATAQAGLTIKVNGETVASNAVSQAIKVEDGSVITVDVTDGNETKTYTLNLKKASSPDIIITEVMTDGYYGYTASGNDNYELIEIYNASGKDLDLLDYSVGYKKDYTYNSVHKGNGADFPYYFTGNNLLVSKETHAGIKELTKYSMYWEDKVDEEPEEVIFKADSTMVIWVKFSPQDTAEARATYGAKLTYETLIAALEAHKGTHTLSVDIDGTEKAVVPQESQIVVAEASVDMKSGSIGSAAGVTAENSQKNWYLENHGGYTGQTRSWLFILKDTAEVASNGKVTEAGNDIISAAKYVRATKVVGKDSNGNDIVEGTNKLSSVFSYNFERGMSLVKNESYINEELVGIGNTSDVTGYSNLTSFGAIEYWQKPADFGDTTAPTITNNTVSQVASGGQGVISLTLADDTDVRYIEVYVKKAGEEIFTKIATKDLVLEAGVNNAGVSADITSTTYTCSVGEVTDTVEYYVVVTDGNGNTTSEGTEATPCKFTLIPKIVQDYTAEEAAAYIGVEAPECEQQGYLFSGWYADEACEKSPIRNVEEASGTVYALFVVDDVLSVKAQISAHLGNDNTADDDKGSIRFVTTVDSLNYLQAGFDVAFDKDGDGTNETYTRVSNKVYQYLYAVGAKDGELEEYAPTVFSSVSSFFKACTVTNVPAAKYSMDFTVTPFWVTPDGLKVEGVTAVKSINDGIYSDYEAEIDGSFYEEIEEAIEVANSDTDATTIIVLNDAEVESQLSITTDVTIQNPERENITIYRGSGLAATDMFSVASGATLTIKGVDDKGTLVLDGRTKAEAVAETSRDAAVGSTGSLISNSGTVNLTNMTVQYVKKTVDKGDGGVINNVSGATIKAEDAVFDNNYTTRYGSVVYSKGNMEFENSVFTNNKAGNNGGVLCHHDGTLFTLDGCTFTSNAGAEGGVIWANKVFTVENSTFDSNAGTGSGGVIRASAPNATIRNNTFTSNTSGNAGGAIYIDGANSLLDNNVFNGNTSTKQGGAVCNYGTTPTVSDCTFINNTAGTNGGGYYSGGGHTVNLKVDDNAAMAIFEGNTASGYGGAIAMGTGKVYVYDYTIKGNSAATGGAIHQNQSVADGAVVSAERTVFDSNSSTGNGGAIYTKSGATLTDCKFVNNQAGSNGGAIYQPNVAGKVILQTSGEHNELAIIQGNKALNGEGGAISMASNGTAELSLSNYTISGNSSYRHGGAINTHVKTTITDCKFDSNKVANDATDDYRGGAIYGGSGRVFTIQATANPTVEPIMTGNVAEQGGAICIGSGTINVTGYTFDGNYTTKAVGGGAIKLNDSAITANITECVFTNNTAQKGGAICADSSATSKASPVTITDCSFIGNKATGLESYVNDGGGAIYANVGVTITLVVTDSTKAIFQNNTSGSTGGAIYFLGTLEGSGYTFTSNSPDDIDARDGSTNNYQ